MKDLSDVEWCALDILMAARKAGVHRVNRMELLYGPGPLPEAVRLQLTFSLLLLSNGPLVDMHGAHDFSITEAGAQLYALRFGPKAAPLATDVICLPDLSGGMAN